MNEKLVTFDHSVSIVSFIKWVNSLSVVCPMFCTFLAYKETSSWLTFAFLIHLMEVVDEEDIIFKTFVTACYYLVSQIKYPLYGLQGVERNGRPVGKSYSCCSR